MELKPYQKEVLQDLGTYLTLIQKHNKIDVAFNEYWKDKVGTYNPLTNMGMPPYKNNIPNAPNVCIKVPTAGGKTYIASNALSVIFNHFPSGKAKFVVWLVPSITILEQTIKNISDTNHPYRKAINTHFSGRVEVYTKESLLQGAGFNPTTVKEQLSIVILSFDSLRSRKKEDRKIYQENGQLASFYDSTEDHSYILENIDETSLMNVIRKMEPVVIVDESHNAESELSVEMLRNLNPSFVLDLTATPRKNSNIISFVNALKLKNENMVKLPVIVYNHQSKSEVIDSAISLRRKLENHSKEEAKNGGKYIRPIVLFQAQAKTASDNTTFEKIKKQLLSEYKIPEEQIKIKTAEINELKGVSLMDPKCPVRYIITVNALKEGWDCPFAYILASLADKSSAVDVEQILGRILRQPYTTKHTQPMLNLSYVLTASAKFQDTLKSIVEGLNLAGFSSKDYKIAEEVKVKNTNKQENPFLPIQPTSKGVPQSANSAALDDAHEPNPEIAKIIQQIEENAVTQNEIYETQAKNISELDTYRDNEVKVEKIHAKDNFYDRIVDLKLSQFYLSSGEGDGGLFGPSIQLLSKGVLLEDFKLSKCDTNIDFTEVNHELYSVDLEEKSKDDYTPSFTRISNSRDTSELLKLILTMTPSNRSKEISNQIVKDMGSMNQFPQLELFQYVYRIVTDFSPDRIQDYFNKDYAYKETIKRKIISHSEDYARKIFEHYLDSNRIVLKESYSIPLFQYPGDTENYGIAKSLYGKEFKMNGFEQRVITDIASLDNVLFWLKNPEMKGFYINGFINHYPDFIVFTKKGTLLLIETKGDDRDNSDSMKKLKLGKTWADKLGNRFKYFMIFDKTKMEDAKDLQQALKAVKDL